MTLNAYESEHDGALVGYDRIECESSLYGTEKQGENTKTGEDDD